MMVVMALVTTTATSPVLWALRLQTVAERELDGLSTSGHAQKDEHATGAANT
jgi:hypothetical protein